MSEEVKEAFSGLVGVVELDLGWEGFAFPAMLDDVHTQAGQRGEGMYTLGGRLMSGIWGGVVQSHDGTVPYSDKLGKANLGGRDLISCYVFGDFG